MIRKALIRDLEVLDDLGVRAINDMHAHGILQWPTNYPRKTHFKADIEADALYVYETDGHILGVMAFYEENDPPYRTVQWLRNKSMVIHRILTDPAAQKSGIAQALLYYAIDYCHKHGYESIKIDTHPSNYRMRHFLKKHQFHELDYIKVMHRIAFERLIERDAMRRIIILGSSGSGKTTLSRMLSEKLGIPYLHLDTVYWERNWTAVSKPCFAKKVRQYIKDHPAFVIDGNYTNSVTFMERLKMADTIIVLNYASQSSLKGIIEREKKYKHRFRSDMATGCIEEIDQEFLHYVYRFDDKLHRMIACVDQFKGQKNILKFKNRQSLMHWFEAL